MPIISARIDGELHEQVKLEAQLEGVSPSKYLKRLIENAVNGGLHFGGHPSKGGEAITLGIMRERLKEKGEEIDYLRQELTSARQATDSGSQRHDTIVLQLTQDLKDTQQQLEDLRKPRRRWWLFGRRVVAQQT